MADLTWTDLPRQRVGFFCWRDYEGGHATRNASFVAATRIIPDASKGFNVSPAGISRRGIGWIPPGSDGMKEARSKGGIDAGLAVYDRVAW